MNQPPYYATPCGDVYGLLLWKYGPSAVVLHMEQTIFEYVWRCRDKGQYASDLEKIETISARIQQILAEHPEASRHKMSLDDMATALSFEGYLVYGPDDAMPERTWRRIGEKEGYLTPMSHGEMAELLKIAGYGIMPPPQGVEAPEVIDDEAQACAQYPPLARTPEPWPRVEDRAGLMQDRVHTEEASRPAEAVRYQPEDADMPTTPPQMPQISHNGTGEGIDTLGQQEEAFSAAPAPPTVLQHCMASEARQGKTVVCQEILEELLRHRIPPDGLWSEWQRDVEQRLPGQWEV